MTEQATRIVQCARHPETETALRCSRCETPICPRCLVQSPVGARCPDCARTIRAPMYLLSFEHVLRALGVSIAGGIGMGIIWGTVGRIFSYGFFLIFVGALLGYGFARMMEFATRGKRGPVIIGFAVAGVLIAWGMQFGFVDRATAQYELIAVAVAAYFIYQELR